MIWWDEWPKKEDQSNQKLDKKKIHSESIECVCQGNAKKDNGSFICEEMFTLQISIYGTDVK